MRKLYTLALCFALLVLVACSDNLFGSSSPSKDDSIKSLRIDAENAFRRGDYKESYRICGLILSKDSTSSFGYYGMAKASLWEYGINPLNMFSLVNPENDVCPFMNENIKTQNNYFQAMKDLVTVLAKLDRRDSLTYLYEFHVRARKDKGWDTNFTVTRDDITLNLNLKERLSEFRKIFCDNSPDSDCSDTTSSGKRKPFPLSDREYKSSYFGSVLLLSVFSKWFLNFSDTNGDDCIALKGIPDIDNPGAPNDPKVASKWEKWGCNKEKTQGEFRYDMPQVLECPKVDGKMSVVINTQKMLDVLHTELEDYYKNEKVANCTNAACDAANLKLIPPDIENFNKKIDEFGSSFGEVSDVLNGVSFSGGEGEDQDLKGEMNKYKAYASFYKMGTHIDEDGDGCIDEDLLDDQDNDGDGHKNANARLASTDSTNKELWGKNAINNSMWGDNPYRDANNWEYNKPMLLPATEAKPLKIFNDPSFQTYMELFDSTGFVTVIAFTQKPGYWTTADPDTKLEVAQDTACPPKISLEKRKQRVGGCWPNYFKSDGTPDECKFVKYWLRRELAYPDVRKTRVHYSCQNHKINECPP